MRLIAHPARGLDGCARPPGDKSISHRALILGALAAGPTDIEGLLEGADVLNTASAMRQVGAEVARLGPGRWRVTGAPSWRADAGRIDFGNSGTGVRLTMGALAGRASRAVLVGDESLSRRPMLRVLEPIAAMGARYEAAPGGRLPVTLEGAARPEALAWESPVASAQVKSAILLAGLAAEGETTVTEPHLSRDHTEKMLPAFGASVRSGVHGDGRAFAAVMGGARLLGRPVAVPADPSSAAFALAAAAIVAGSDVALEDVLLNPQRVGFLEALRAMGADLVIEPVEGDALEPVGRVQVRHGPALRGVAPDPAHVPAFIDEVPILAVAAAFAEGETRITGAEDLKNKESDRIALTVAGLRACGVEAEALPDGLIVLGRGPGGVAGGAAVATHGDHRIAMSFLVLGLAAQAPVIVDEAEMIATSFPDFAGFMAGLGADIRAA